MTEAARELAPGGTILARASRLPPRLVPPVMAIVVLVVVGGAGIAAGVALDRVMMTRQSPWLSAPASAQIGQRVSSRFARELSLAPEQRVRIDSILVRQMTAADALRQEYQPRVRAIMAETRAAVDSVLTPAQRDRLRAMSRGAAATDYR
jgi:Spy/CpxP family protein refolding chaperone